MDNAAKWLNKIPALWKTFYENFHVKAIIRKIVKPWRKDTKQVLYEMSHLYTNFSNSLTVIDIVNDSFWQVKAIWKIIHFFPPELLESNHGN